VQRRAGNAGIKICAPRIKKERHNQYQLFFSSFFRFFCKKNPAADPLFYYPNLNKHNSQISIIQPFIYLTVQLQSFCSRKTALFAGNTQGHYAE
jgi:hypothetical protein